MNKLMELRQELAKLYAEERSDLERAQRENRGLSAAENEQSAKREERIKVIEDECQAIETVNARAAKLAERESSLRSMPAQAGVPATAGDATRSAQAEKAERRAMVSYLLGDRDEAAKQMRAAHEMRGTHNATVFGQGGALVLPMEMSQSILQLTDAQTFIGDLVTTDTLTMAASLGIPTIETDPADADWTAELATGSDGDIVFGGRQLTPYPLAKRVKLSNKLLSLSPRADSVALERLSYKFAVTQEKAMLTGNGINQPLGMLANSGAGAIPVGRDVAGAVTWDNVYDVVNLIPAQYETRLSWITHRNHLTTLRKTKDSQGRYLVDINTANNGGVTTTLATYPVRRSEFFPSATSGTGNYTFLLGDFKAYNRVVVSAIVIQVLRELYAEQNTTGFIGRFEMDGMPTFGEPFARLKFA